MTETATTGPPTLDEVYREHRLALLRLAYLLTGSRDQSEDVVQSAFAAVCQRWADVSEPLPYLKRTVVNLAKDGFRRRAQFEGVLVLNRFPDQPRGQMLAQFRHRGGTGWRAREANSQTGSGEDSPSHGV